MTLPTLLVCGGRDFTDRDLLFTTLDRICRERGWTTPPDPHGHRLPRVRLVNGAARGADDLAAHWAGLNECEVLTYPAKWRQHGRVAGPIRNQLMLDDGKPHLVVAFPGGAGTRDMVKRAEAAGVEIVVVRS